MSITRTNHTMHLTTFRMGLTVLLAWILTTASATGQTLRLPQSPARPLGLQPIASVMVQGSDSRSQTFNTKYLPKVMELVNEKFREGVAFQNPGAIPIDPSRMTVINDYAVRAYFIHEGAGYKNTVGVQLDGVDKLLFPDCSYDGLNGVALQRGDFVDLGIVRAGTKLDLFVFPNGAAGGLGGVQYRLATTPAASADKRQHFVGYWIENTPLLLFGAEDLLWSGDDDFEDVLVVMDFGAELNLPKTYYVRASGNDARNGLTPQTAFKTISKAASTVKAGDTVFVGAGTYSESSTVYFTTPGAQAVPTLFQADRDGSRTGDAGDVTIVAPNATAWTWYVNGASNYTFDGFRFIETQGVRYFNYDEVDNAAEDTAYWNAYNSRVWPHGFAATNASNISLKNCRFEQMRYGAHFSGCSSAVVENCTFRDSRYMQLYFHSTTGGLVKGCTFDFPSPQPTGEQVYSLYGWNSAVEVANCTFDNTGPLKGHNRDYYTTYPTRSYKWRGVYGAYFHGTGYHSDAGVNLGNNYLHDNAFRNHNDWALVTAWDITSRIEKNQFLNCRYSLHSHAEEMLVQGNVIEQDTNSPWKAMWSLGVYANRWSDLSNKWDDYAKTNYKLQRTKPNGTAKVYGNTVKKTCYAVNIASNSIELKDNVVEGDTRYTEDDKGWTWQNFTVGVYTGWNATNVTFTDLQNTTLTNTWVGYQMDDADLTVTYKDITIADQFHGAYHSNGTVKFENAKVLRNKFAGSGNWWLKGFTATSSQFSDNCFSNRGGWGLYVYGTKTPRTPAPTEASPNPSWDWWTEIDLWGTRNKTPISIVNCQFINNGKMTVDTEKWTLTTKSGNGLFIGFADKSALTLSGNRVEDNYYGAYFYDCDVALRDNREFTQVKGNVYGLWTAGPWNSKDYSDTRRPSTMAVSNYSCFSGNWHALGAWDSTFTVTGCTVKDNCHVGVGAWNSYFTVTGTTSSKNGDGIHGGYNLKYDIQNCNFSDNRWTGTYLYVFRTMNGKDWPKASYKVQNIQSNNNSNGMYAYLVDHTEKGSWANGTGGFDFDISQATFNNNKSHGLYLGFGSLVKTSGLAITANNNGTYDEKGNGNWAIGVYMNVPGKNITLSNSTGIEASGNSWAGILVQGHEWYWKDDLQKYVLKMTPEDLTVSGYTGGRNRYYNIYGCQLRNVTITNSNIAGMWLANPQGSVTVDNSQFIGGHAGLGVTWGDWEYWNELASGQIENEWWNKYAIVGDTYTPPVKVTAGNSKFNDNDFSGLYAYWWHNWEKETSLTSPSSKRCANVTLSNCQFNDNGLRGFETYNQGATVTTVAANGNAYSGGVIWRGDATITNSSFDNNGYGRYDANTGRYDAATGDKQSWVACELTDWYEWSPGWKYTIKNSTFNTNEGIGLLVWDYGGTATVENVTANNNYHQGVEVTRVSASIKNVTTNNGRGHGQLYVYNPTITVEGCTSTGNGKNNAFAAKGLESGYPYSWGIYVHGEYLLENERYYAVKKQVGNILNCVSNGNTGYGILNWCNSGIVSGCTANDNGTIRPDGSFYGQGIQVGYSEKDSINKHKVLNCTAMRNGWAGLYVYRCESDIQNCRFDDNNYGGFHQYTDNWCPTRGKCLVSNTTFNNNGCYGIDNYGTSSDIRNVQGNGNGYKNGAPTEHGGYGLILTDYWEGKGDSSVNYVADSTFNSNAYHGVYSYYQKDHLIERCTMKGNGEWGYISYGKGTAQNNVIVNNKSGAYVDDVFSFGSKFLNNTVANNAYISVRPYRGTVELRNNIITGGQWGLHVDSASLLSSNNLIYGASSGDYWHPTMTADQLRGLNDVNKPPRFTNPESGDYTLAVGSPAINSGADLSAYYTRDLAGNQRPMYKVFDIGAYESSSDNASFRILNWSEQK